MPRLKPLESAASKAIRELLEQDRVRAVLDRIRQFGPTVMPDAVEPPVQLAGALERSLDIPTAMREVEPPVIVGGRPYAWRDPMPSRSVPPAPPMGPMNFGPPDPQLMLPEMNVPDWGPPPLLAPKPISPTWWEPSPLVGARPVTPEPYDLGNQDENNFLARLVQPPLPGLGLRRRPREMPFITADARAMPWTRDASPKIPGGTGARPTRLLNNEGWQAPITDDPGPGLFISGGRALEQVGEMEALPSISRRPESRFVSDGSDEKGEVGTEVGTPLLEVLRTIRQFTKVPTSDGSNNTVLSLPAEGGESAVKFVTERRAQKPFQPGAPVPVLKPGRQLKPLAQPQEPRLPGWRRVGAENKSAQKRQFLSEKGQQARVSTKLPYAVGESWTPIPESDIFTVQGPLEGAVLDLTPERGQQSLAQLDPKLSIPGLEAYADEVAQAEAPLQARLRRAKKPGVGHIESDFTELDNEAGKQYLSDIALGRRRPPEMLPEYFKALTPEQRASIALDMAGARREQYFVDATDEDVTPFRKRNSKAEKTVDAEDFLRVRGKRDTGRGGQRLVKGTDDYSTDGVDVIEEELSQFLPGVSTNPFERIVKGQARSVMMPASQFKNLGIKHGMELTIMQGNEAVKVRVKQVRVPLELTDQGGQKDRALGLRLGRTARSVRKLVDEARDPDQADARTSLVEVEFEPLGGRASGGAIPLEPAKRVRRGKEVVEVPARELPVDDAEAARWAQEQADDKSPDLSERVAVQNQIHYEKWRDGLIEGMVMPETIRKNYTMVITDPPFSREAHATGNYQKYFLVNPKTKDVLVINYPTSTGRARTTTYKPGLMGLLTKMTKYGEGTAERRKQIEQLKGLLEKADRVTFARKASEIQKKKKG